MTIVRITRRAIAASLIFISTMPAFADNYPSRPIHWIVPFAPGGLTDIVARLVGQKLSEAWGQQVIVENRPGAGGIVGTNVVATAPPDGYTIGGISLSFTIYPVLYDKVPFDVFDSFLPITMMSMIPSVLIVNPEQPIHSVEDLIKEAKASPGKIGFADGGVGTGGHVGGELFKKMTGVDMTHIPYRGGGPAVTAVIAGEVPISFSTASLVFQAVRAGEVRAVAVTSPQRIPQLPNVPTVAESGVPGFETQEMQGVVAPVGVPKEIITKLNTEIVRILQLPDIKEKLTNLGAPPQTGSPDDLSKYLHSEVAKWKIVFNDTAVKAK
jgi:tripartite-type tricarboxylate transporter receptor subunit TctC